jgi:parallel beta-helix repeat protein
VAGYAKQRSNWLDFPATSTPILEANLDAWETALYNLKYLTYNVKDFGAVGDGVADDTSEIQDALNQAGNGGTILFPPGIYLITASLSIPSWTNLIGADTPFRAVEITGGNPAGNGGSIIQIGGAANFHMFQNSDQTNGNTTIKFEGLKLSQTGASGDVDIVRLKHCWRTQFVNCYFLGWTTTNRRGLHLNTSSEQCWIQRCTFDGCGIYAVNTSSVYVDYCVLNAGNNTIDLDTGYNNHVTDCHVFSSNASSGMQLSAQNEAVITGNSIHDNKQHGIYMPRNNQRCIISGNTVCNNSLQTTTTWDGIALDSDTPASPTQKNIIVGNQCFDRQGTPTQAYGISLRSNSGTQTNKNTVVGNQCDLNVSGAIFEGAGLNNHIADNTPNSPVTSVASAAALNIPSTPLVIVSGTTNVTSMGVGNAGRTVSLKFSGVLTFTHGNNIFLAGAANFVTANNSVLTLVSDGANWFEVARKA